MRRQERANPPVGTQSGWANARRGVESEPARSAAGLLRENPAAPALRRREAPLRASPSGPGDTAIRGEGVAPTGEDRPIAASTPPVGGAPSRRNPERPDGEQVVNALTIDVEDYFQVSAFEDIAPRETWDARSGRVEASMHRMLDVFAEHEVRTTCFTLGWIAERYPALVRRIVADGHELASHGYDHRRVTELDECGFREDLARARGLLEDTGGTPVRGYRAPSFSIDARTPWAWQALTATGHTYSSSVYPIRHDHYGMPDSPLGAHHPAGEKSAAELPVAALPAAGRTWPAAGGGYFRLLPYGVSRWSLRRINAEGRCAIFYLHPWEIDPDQPRMPGIPAKTRFRHYVGLRRTEGRLRRLLQDFAWDRIDRIFPEVME